MLDFIAYTNILNMMIQNLSELFEIEEKSFYQRVIIAIKDIPRGKVATYGQVALVAGNPRAARQVSYILHSSTEKYALPWHRVVNSKGSISLKPKKGYELQIKLLKKEGVVFDKKNCIDLKKFGMSHTINMD
ncbi:MAG: MGMT family protein [bacterium]|nr:MGMT family protein [bacterium]